MNLSTQQVGIYTFFAVIFGLLGIVTLIVWTVKQRKKDDNSALLLLKIKSWWYIIIGIFAVATTPFWVGSTILCWVSAMAFQELVGIIPLKTDKRPFLYIGILLIINQYINSSHPLFFFLTIPLFTVTALIYTRLTQKSRLQNLLMFSLLASGYLLSFTLLILKTNVGLFLFLITLTSLNDVFQYTWGNLFGRHKIIPTISPNKTWEGFIGGILSTVLLANLLYFFTPFTHTELSITGLLLSVAGFLGDALISSLKRTLQIKDTGTAIPGHGGIMDRLDSLVLTAPVFYLVLLGLGK